jgi:hypothetical protein
MVLLYHRNPENNALFVSSFLVFGAYKPRCVYVSLALHEKPSFYFFATFGIFIKQGEPFFFGRKSKLHRMYPSDCMERGKEPPDKKKWKKAT